MTIRSAALGRRGVGEALLTLVCATLLVIGVLSSSAVAQTEPRGGATPARISGSDRFETAARIADEAFGGAEVALLATGRDFPDALAGAFAAGHLPGPVLLVEQDAVPSATLGMLSELGVGRVVLGRAVIGEKVEQALDEHGYLWSRIAGEDRYATTAQVALEHGQDQGRVGGAGGAHRADG